MPVSASVRSAIDTQNKAFMDLFNSNKIDEMSQKVYTTDCKLCPQNSPEILGREGVAAVFKSVRGMGCTKVVLTTKEIDGSDQGPVYEYGLWQFFTDDGSSPDNGKYVVIWKLENGNWYYYIDIFSSNVAK